MAPGGLAGVGRWNRPFLALLAALIALLVAVPLVGYTSQPRPAVDVLFSLVLVAGIAAASGRSGHLRIGAVLGVVALATRWGAYAIPHPTAAIVTLSSSLAFLGFTAASVLSVLARERRVSADTVSGGICVYLLAGVAWALAFNLVDVVRPGSLGLPLGLPDPSTRELLYFSFVTMTTLGYGDIVPVSQAARTLAVGEAVFGQLFVAVFIARLVGLYSAHLGEE